MGTSTAGDLRQTRGNTLRMTLVSSLSSTFVSGLPREHHSVIRATCTGTPSCVMTTVGRRFSRLGCMQSAGCRRSRFNGCVLGRCKVEDGRPYRCSRRGGCVTVRSRVASTRCTSMVRRRLNRFVSSVLKQPSAKGMFERTFSSMTSHCGISALRKEELLGSVLSSTFSANTTFSHGVASVVSTLAVGRPAMIGHFGSRSITCCHRGSNC